MTAVVEFFTKYDLIISIVFALVTLIYAIALKIRNRKRIKSATSTEERIAIINDIKSRVMGFITIAENLFSDIPKSGASKLLYVLNQVKDLCKNKGIEYDPTIWTDFINSVVANSNRVQEEKSFEDQKANIIEKVKSEIPFIVKEANKLFERIPDSVQYKVEYILKFVAVACEKYPVNVYTVYDWRGYVNGLYNEVQE